MTLALDILAVVEGLVILIGIAVCRRSWAKEEAATRKAWKADRDAHRDRADAAEAALAQARDDLRDAETSARRAIGCLREIAPDPMMGTRE